MRRIAFAGLGVLLLAASAHGQDSGAPHALIWFECTGIEHRDPGTAAGAASDAEVTDVLAVDEHAPRLFSYEDGVLAPEPGTPRIDHSSIRLEAEAATPSGFVKMETTLDRATGALAIAVISSMDPHASFHRQEHCLEVPAKPTR